MLRFIIRWLIVAAALVALPRLVPGIHVYGWGPALVGAAILGLLNVVIRPALVLFTMPVTVLTLGLFLVVINGAILAMAGAITAGISIDNFPAALVGALVVALVTTLCDHIFGETNVRSRGMLS